MLNWNIWKFYRSSFILKMFAEKSPANRTLAVKISTRALRKKYWNLQNLISYLELFTYFNKKQFFFTLILICGDLY